MTGNERAVLGTDEVEPDTQVDGQRVPRRRRSFLVNRRYQLRTAALVATVVLVLLVFLNLSIYSSGLSESERVALETPELEAFVKAQDRTLVFLVVLGSMVFLVGVFLVSVLETHKTAGACVNLAGRLDDIRDGRYDTTLRLRRDDHLVELEPVFNRMARAMQQRTWEEIEALEDLASRIERATPAIDPSRIAEEIRGIAGRKRSMLE